jgi:ATP-dependent DNA helicase 2 subunit 2
VSYLNRYTTGAKPTSAVLSSSDPKVTISICYTIGSQSSADTDNIINERNGGYEHVTEYIPIAQPNAGTLAKLDELEPSTVIGDRTLPYTQYYSLLGRSFVAAVDALIVSIETQDEYLHKKKTWIRKIVILTDGQNPIEVEDWEATVKKMDSLSIGLMIMCVICAQSVSFAEHLLTTRSGVDFDDEELPYYEENKSKIKVPLTISLSHASFSVQQRANEEFYKTLTSAMKTGIVGTCALALRETTRPDIKATRSTLMGTILRLGDVEVRPDEALEISIKTSKCTSVQSPKGWKKFGRREADGNREARANHEEGKATFVQLRMRTEYYIDRSEDHEDEIKNEVDADGDQTMKDGETKAKEETLEKVEKEQLIRGFKYGSTFVPCPDGQFPRLNTTRGIDICGFFQAKNVRLVLAFNLIRFG